MADDLVARARNLHATIIEHRAETESQRQLAEPIVEALRASGLCRLFVESALDGLETDPVVALQVFEELAVAEASVAWVVWNCAAPVFFGQYLADEPRARIFGNPSHTYASSTRPTGRAVITDEGLRVSGRWSLVSGCMHAAVLGFLCVPEKDGEVVMGDAGLPLLRMVFVPHEACRIIDTWHVGGLRGTGSHDVVLEDVEVPLSDSVSPFEDRRIDRPLGRMPTAATMSAGHAAVCLGIARGALDDALQIGRTKVSVDPAPAMRDRPGNQRAVAEAAASIAGTRAHLHESLGRMWQVAQSGEPMANDVIAQVWAAAAKASSCARETVASMYATGGTTALYTDCALERRHRDIHGTLQHIVAQPFWFEQAGMVMLGLEPTNPLFAI